jgi:hypothetical protein
VGPSACLAALLLACQLCQQKLWSFWAHHLHVHLIAATLQEPLAWC